VNIADLRYVPDFRLEIGGTAIPAALRASVVGIKHESGLEGADRVEVTLVNENLRWLDHPLLKLDQPLALHLGYAPARPVQVFVGEIVAVAAAFPADGPPTVTVVAQDRRQRLQQGNKLRWFAIPIPTVGNFPLPDLATVALVSLENMLIPIIDPVGAAIAVLLGGVEAVAAISDPGSAQKFIRKEANESDYKFLMRIAKENGWEMVVDHSGPLGGHLLRFTSPLDHLSPDVTLQYGRSLIEFTPRITSVGQIFSVTAFIWITPIKMTFAVTLGWDWDRMALTLMIYPAGITLQPGPSHFLIKDPVTPLTAPRRIIGELLPKLNKRLTGTGGTIGNPLIKAGAVLKLEGLGETFGGLWRVTKATQSIGPNGYRTDFETRKEIWFGSIPAPVQGAIPIRTPFGTGSLPLPGPGALAAPTQIIPGSPPVPGLGGARLPGPTLP